MTKHATARKDGTLPGPVFGHIPGYPVGSRFENRAALAEARVHRHRQAGISGSATKGADSIVLSGGYEDDQDFGNLIIYTGYGGRDPATGRQVSDQPFSLWNRALAYSSLNGLPVRVIRGEGHESRYSPSAGYRYDGLYLVDDYWQDRGRTGFLVWRYRLIKLPDQLDQESDQQSGIAGVEVPSEAARRETTVLRIVRDTKQARRIKELYDYRCQICGIRLEALAGPYAEAAHIRPLGAPHNGPDTLDNTLCLCPNHHVLFDHCGITIDEDLSLVGVEGRLAVHPRHCINDNHLRYRREHYQANT
jgi:putative restriction endonuclease